MAAAIPENVSSSELTFFLKRVFGKELSPAKIKELIALPQDVFDERVRVMLKSPLRRESLPNMPIMLKESALKGGACKKTRKHTRRRKTHARRARRT